MDTLVTCTHIIAKHEITVLFLSVKLVTPTIQSYTVQHEYCILVHVIALIQSMYYFHQLYLLCIILPTGSVATAPVPRGIVTATTVPRGTVPVVHQQQTQPQTALAKQQISGNSVQSRPTVTTHSSAVSQSMATPTASVTIAPTGSNSNSSQPSSAPNVLSQKAARDLHAQLVALQHSAGTQQLSPELLAQVHSLLNLSSSLVYTADTGSEEGDGTAHLESDISATQATSLSTSPRSTGEPGKRTFGLAACVLFCFVLCMYRKVLHVSPPSPLCPK